jgi:predicted nucleotide-binding protein
MLVFLASSTESLDRLREVASWLEASGADVLPWDAPHLFQLGENTLDALVRISKSVDAAVFIFGEDDKIWYRSDTLQQPRDNVLIEYGLFVGVLGPKRAIIAKSGSPKTASDLHGLTCVDVSTQKASSLTA